MKQPYRIDTLCGEIISESNKSFIVYPSQAVKRNTDQDFCVLCGSIMTHQATLFKDRGCTNSEQIVEITKGFLWWKRKENQRINIGCPQFHHIHRLCAHCGGCWIEKGFITPELIES